MKTLNEIKSEINVEAIRNNDTYGVYEGDSDNQLINAALYATVTEMIKNASKETSTKSARTTGGMATYNYSYEITNDSVLELLRTLYTNTNNNFVKEVIKTVGQTKNFSEKQIGVIVDEMIKFNLTFNF